MFKRQKSVQTKASASMLSNNLAVTLNVSSGGLADLAFVHKSVVHMILSDADKEPASADRYIHKQVVCKAPSANQQETFVMVLQADWVEVAGRKILVIATQKGIKIYDSDAITLLHWHGFGSGDGTTVFTRGISSIGSTSVCVGTSSGQLLIFRVPSKGGNITFEEYLSGHEHSITAVVSRGDNFVSSDENGDIILWNHYDGTSFKQITKIVGDDNPCNCIDLWKGMVIAGFGNGMVKVYDLSAGNLLADIRAHARSVNALHIAQGSGLCITASDDTFVRVFQLSVGSEFEVNHVFNDELIDHQLVGAQFTDNEGSSFALTAYDSNEVFLYKRV